MPQRKHRHSPEVVRDAPIRPRAARDHDGFVASPVHAMYRNLWAFSHAATETPVRLYPGWIRLAVPLVGSGALWLIIFWSLGFLR